MEKSSNASKKSYKKKSTTTSSKKKISTNSKTSAMERFKMEAASEVGVTLKKSGENGHLTAKQAGAIGGRMVKKMIESYKKSHK